MKLPFSIIFILLAMEFLPASDEKDLSAILAPLVLNSQNTQKVSQFPSQTKQDESPLTEITEAALISELQNSLKQHLNLEGDLRISLTQEWKPIAVSAAEGWSVKILQVPSNGLGATSLVRFRIESAGRRVGEWHMILRAQLWREVWAASTRIERGTILSESLLKKINVDVLRENQPLIPARADLSAYQAASLIKPDSLLTWRDVSQREVIRRGQIVEVIAAEGPMIITLKGIAMTSGGIGDEIVVRNMDSRRDITARVTSPTTAKVNF
ncbi:MAG: flagellar basal body P-ring formation chaperone FlgA [Chthoniobacterales bacterium]|nr:flagellar basal body P-ring formation chaperone FlgA [Chthoniobacterales bacterium]MCX7713232.1 flagellar basal body P-ring formation chaperone FlgA [Chthoniobacterales bacterium]